VCAGLACTAYRNPGTAQVTEHDKTKRGAIGGAVAGAIAGAVLGEGEADEILVGAAIGAGVGAGIGAYMDRQEHELVEIPGATVERVGDDMLLVHMDSDVLFDPNSAILSSSARASLDRAAGVFLDYPATAIVVQGHADRTTNEQTAVDLSQRRADAVKNYLVGRGVDGSRIASVGYGATYAESHANNRRVDLLIKARAT
jgi:outer membrane protein OmpA-like peptidoglycan-associated protein